MSNEEYYAREKMACWNEELFLIKAAIGIFLLVFFFAMVLFTTHEVIEHDNPKHVWYNYSNIDN